MPKTKEKRSLSSPSEVHTPPHARDMSPRVAIYHRPVQASRRYGRVDAHVKLLPPALAASAVFHGGLFYPGPDTQNLSRGGYRLHPERPPRCSG